MAACCDPYPTRLHRRLSPIHRREPVMHADGGQRRDGPLRHEDLASFERNGFLVLPNFFRPREVGVFLDDLDSVFRLAEPFAAPTPRPEWVASRTHDAALRRRRDQSSAVA